MTTHDPPGEQAVPAVVSGTSRRVRMILGIAAGIALATGALSMVVATRDDAAANSVNPTAYGESPIEGTDGTEHHLNQFVGAPLVVNYFASWCAPCRAELPAFNTVSDDLEGDVVVIGISRDLDKASWMRFVETMNVSFSTFYEGAGEGTFEEIGALALPATAFVREDGSLAEIHSGPLDESTLRSMIKEHLTSG